MMRENERFIYPRFKNLS